MAVQFSYAIMINYCKIGGHAMHCKAIKMPSGQNCSLTAAAGVSDFNCDQTTFTLILILIKVVWFKVYIITNYVLGFDSKES